MTTRTCAECSKPYEPRVPKQLFCGTPCREEFNRRRRDRGAELYDVFMSNRFDDDGAPKDRINRLVASYRDADFVKRDGRPSWKPWAEAQMDLPKAYSRDGDRR